MTVGVTQAGASARAPWPARRPATRRASLAAYAAQAGIPRARVRARRAGGRGQARADARLRRADAARARRLRRLPAAGRARRARSSASTSLNSINPFRIEGQKTIVLELLQQLDWEPPDWIVAARRQPRQHRAFGKALLRGARAGADHADAAPGRRAGRRRGAVRAELRRGVRARATRVQAETRRHRHPHRRSGVVRSRRARDPRDRRRRARGDATRRSSRPRRSSTRAGVGCEPASAASVAGVRELVQRGHRWRRRARRGGADRAHSQGSRDAAHLSPRHSAAAGGSQPADRDRRDARGDRAGADGLSSARGGGRRSQRFTIRQIFPLSSAETYSAPSLPTARPTGRNTPVFMLAKVSYFPVGLPSTNGANTTR